MIDIADIISFLSVWVLWDECLCFPQMHLLTLNPQCDAIWRGTFGR